MHTRTKIIDESVANREKNCRHRPHTTLIETLDHTVKVWFKKEWHAVPLSAGAVDHTVKG
jgi:hypothetical protein